MPDQYVWLVWSSAVLRTPFPPLDVQRWLSTLKLRADSLGRRGGIRIQVLLHESMPADHLMKEYQASAGCTARASALRRW
jgi:hypothetical protein